VGASGSGSGLMAAASRLMTPDRRLAPFFSQPVVVMALAFLIANLIIALVGWAPGAGDAQVAWEAHLGGYASGLLLFGPLVALLRRT
jgi:membrane associated rhomboid family serine protease